jgi:hypothetical protein
MCSARTIGLAVIVVAAGLTPPASAQPLESQEATAPGPKEAFGAANRFADLRVDRRVLHRKQQNLRVTPRPLPGKQPGRLAAHRPMAGAPPVAQTAVLPLNRQPAGRTFIDLSNRVLTDAETDRFTSTVGEPSLAVRGDEILVTGNWFAAFSTDAGVTFSHVDPFTRFPAPPDQEFCCDQVAIYDKAHDLVAWFLQYDAGSKPNIVRLAVAAGKDDIRSQKWRYYDFTTKDLGNENEAFDYPDLVLGSKYLYLSSNVYTLPGAFSRSVMLRLPLDELSQYKAFYYRYFSTADVGSLRPTHGATDVMYFGAHVDFEKTVRVFSWPESGNDLTAKDVTVQAFKFGGATARGPDGHDWMGFSDGRITGAWLARNQIGFAWNAAQDADQGGNLAFPHVRVVLLDAATMATVAEPHIWNSAFAFSYPGAAPNADGSVGISIAYGGGSSLYPSHAVGVLNPPPNPGEKWSWQLVMTGLGVAGPQKNRWGDYLSVRTDGKDPKAWVATGYVLKDTAGVDESSAVHYLHFRLSPGSPQATPMANSAEIARLKHELEGLKARMAELEKKLDKK